MSRLLKVVAANTVTAALYALLAGSLIGRAASVYWLGLALALFAVAVLGSLVAGTIAGALGFFGASSFWAAQRTGLGIALVLAMTVGMGIAIYEGTRARLDETRERLQVQELEVERAQRLATDARMASLESRLHPHFLFRLKLFWHAVSARPHHDSIEWFLLVDSCPGCGATR